jgi:hypothetical protein
MHIFLVSVLVLLLLFIIILFIILQSILVQPLDTELVNNKYKYINHKIWNCQ